MLLFSAGVGGVNVEHDALRAYISSNVSFFLSFFGKLLWYSIDNWMLNAYNKGDIICIKKSTSIIRWSELRIK